MHRNGDSGELFEEVNHCFTVEMWVQSGAAGESTAVWRGRVVHIPSGTVHHFQCDQPHWADQVCHGIRVCGHMLDADSPCGMEP